ncbi:MAG: amino acid adenylation domain-containing protein [Synechococcales bacterium]|nr:amino acid adenylation domain-containing protein [Synechococcales bacterium]
MNFTFATQSTHSSVHATIHQWFEAQVNQSPQAIALAFQHQTLTYQTLNQRANQLAHYLIAQGVQPGELVAISMHRCFEMVIGFLGVLKAGAAYVPIDPAYPVERQAYMLQDCQARIILTQQSLADTLSQITKKIPASDPTIADPTIHATHSTTPEIKKSYNSTNSTYQLTQEDTPPQPRIPQPRILCLDNTWEQTIAPYSVNNPDLAVSPEQHAYVIYTSGSTGNPKGVKIPHRGLVNHSAAIIPLFELTHSDRVMQFSSMSFDIIVEELYPTLVSGGMLVLRTEEISASIRQFLSFVETQQITVLNLPTAFWHEWVNCLTLLHLPVPASIRLVIVGGEKASRVAYGEWVNHVGQTPRWLNTYGPTETTVTATVYDPIASQYDPQQGEIPIGKPIANAEVYVLDEQLQPVPFGAVGELHIGGPGVALEYHNRPDRTAEKFIPHPYQTNPHARLYKTGDTVRCLPDGNLQFVGRIDFQVKLRGFRIELGEIEIALEQHPAIRQAIVMMREETEGDRYLAAYLLPEPESALGQPLDIEAVRAYLTQKLPTYMIPTALMPLESFPVTPNGKIDRHALPIPPKRDSGGSKLVVAPANATEAKLLKLWESILGMSPISTIDNFFDLGGHSLLVARLLDQIAAEFGKQLPLSTIVDAPTIEQLAKVLTEPKYPSSIHLIRAGGNKAPIFFIHDGVGETLLYRNLAYHLDMERPIYGIRPFADADRPILHTRIESMAAYYLDLIRSVQTEGPYFLAGLCAGGVLSYEIARQLQAQGQTIGMVALLDAVSPLAELNSGIEQQQRLHRLSQTLKTGQTSHPVARVAKLAAIVGKKLWNGVTYEMTTRLQTQVETVKLRLFQSYCDRLLTPPRWLSPASVLTTYLFAEQSYRPTTPLQGSILLLKASQGEGIDQPYRLLCKDAKFGWETLVTQGVQVYDIPGGHGSMLQEPHARVLADRLQTYLDQTSLAQGDRGSTMDTAHPTAHQNTIDYSISERWN